MDEAESGRISDRPQFRKMIDEAFQSDAPFREMLVWKFSRFAIKREHAVAFKSMRRREGVREVSITEHAVWGANAKDKAEPARIEKAFPAIIRTPCGH